MYTYYAFVDYGVGDKGVAVGDGSRALHATKNILNARPQKHSQQEKCRDSTGNFNLKILGVSYISY